MPHHFVSSTSSTLVSQDAPLDGHSGRDDVAGVTGRFDTASLAAASIATWQQPIRAGLYGIGTNGVQGESTSAGASGVWGNNSRGGYGVAGTSDQPGGIGVLGRGQALAARFEGDVEVTGDIRLQNADLAEDFELAEGAEADAGTVLVIAERGALRPCEAGYDTRAAGIVSGAGHFQAAIVLDRQQRSPGRRRAPVALVGKVCCKVDAGYGAIAAGDLLTTSPTTGHAMRASDPALRNGAIVGKALAALDEGCGLLPVFVTHR